MIQITDLRKSFGQNEVLKGISLNVTLGEVLCIIGPSGSGKSTILRCINGLESYDSGEIRIEDHLVDRENKKYLLGSHPCLNGFSAF